MSDNAAKAEQLVADGVRIAERSRGRDLASSHLLAAAQVHATLAVAEAITAAHGPHTETRAEPRRLPEQKVMPCGSAGLCMAARVHPSGAEEFCHFPHMHTGPHSWADLGGTN